MNAPKAARPKGDIWDACGCPNPDDCEHVFYEPAPSDAAVREAAEIARRILGSPEHVELWAAIHEFDEARTVIAREHAVVRVESGLRAVIAAALAARGGE